MALVTPETYRLLTRDYAPEGKTINDAVGVAEELLQVELNRKFPSTAVVNEMVSARYLPEERLYKAFPEYMPVTTISTTGWVIGKNGEITSELVGLSIVFNVDNVSPHQPLSTPISYTGGWTATTAPTTLKLAIAKLAQNIIKQFDPLGNVVPFGVKSTSMGSMRVDFGESMSQRSIITDDVMLHARGFRRV